MRHCTLQIGLETGRLPGENGRGHDPLGERNQELPDQRNIWRSNAAPSVSLINFLRTIKLTSSFKTCCKLRTVESVAYSGAAAASGSGKASPLSSATQARSTVRCSGLTSVNASPIPIETCE